MPAFVYKARLPTGAVVERTIDAVNINSAILSLRNQKLVVLEINEFKKSIFSLIKEKSPLKPKVKSEDIVIFSRQLATMVSAGIPLIQGLSILSEQMENPAFKDVLTKIKSDIESGLSITEAMKRHQKIFGELYVSMINAGEVGGILDIILDRLSTYLEKAEELKGKVKSAMTYPIVVFSIAIGVTFFLLTSVIPTFKNIFESFGAALPAPTMILLGVSDLLKNFWYVVLGIPVGIVMALKRIRKTQAGALKIDRTLLKLPKFGIILKKVAVAKFTRTLSTLIKSGVPILQALETVAKTSGNKVIEIAIMQSREAVKEGEKISEPLKRTKVFPPMVLQMIAVGEETGNLDTMLSKIADFYDSEVDSAVKGLTSIIEPIVIAFLGVVVGAIIIAMFLPMFQLGQLAASAG